MGNLKVLFGGRVRQLRIERNITQEKLAEAMDVSVRYISDIENGVTWPRADKIEKIAQVFEVKYRDLFNFPEEVL